METAIPARKGKLKQFIRKHRAELLALAVPMAVMLVAYLTLPIWPFGAKSHSAMVLDLTAQYVHYFDSLKDFFTGDMSLIYSWYRNLGGEMLGVSTYYLMSPFLLLVVLIPQKFVTEAVLLMLLLKIGCTGLTFGSYIRHRRNATELETVVFGSMFALNGYMIVHLHNLMWLDCIILLPLIIWALEVLVDKGRFFPLCGLLFLSFVSNYYIAYMMGILTAVYYVYYVLVEWQGDDRFYTFFAKGFKFVLTAALAALMALVIIAGAWYSLEQGKLEFTDPNFTPESYFTTGEFLAKLLPASYDTVRREGLPMVYTSVLGLLLTGCFFLSGKYKLKEKLGAALFLILMFFLMKISTLDIMMHGFQVPNWLNHRYAFYFSFMVAIFALKGFRTLTNGKRLPIMLSAASVAGILVWAIYKDYDYVDIFCIATTAASLLAYLLAFFDWNKDRRWAVKLLCAVLILETAINGVHTVHSMDMDLVYNHRYLHRDMMDTWQGAVDWVYDHDDSFYRLEKTYTRTANDNMTLGVRGLTHSSSAPNRKALTLLRDFGFKGSSSVSHYMDAVPTTDALFHFKYILTRDPALYGDYVKIGETAEGVSIYENQKALSIGYMADSAIYDFGEQDLSGLAPFRCQNNFIKDLTGTDRNVFEKIEVLSTTLDNCKLDASGSQNFYHKVDKAEPATITYTLSAKDGQKLYLYFGCYNQHDVTVSVDGRDLGYYFDGDSFVVAAGPMAGDTCEVVLTLKEDKTAMYEHQVYFYTLNEEAWAAAYDLLADELYQVTDWDSRSLKGTIDVKNDGVFMTSIPYETGWNIRVDGKPVEGKCVGTAFLAFDLNAGEHTVELSFMPRIVVLGACGSAVGIGLYLIILVLEIRKIRKEQWVRIMAWSAFCQERAQELRNRQEFRLQKMAEAHDIRRMERIKRLMEEQIKQELE